MVDSFLLVSMFLGFLTTFYVFLRFLTISSFDLFQFLPISSRFFYSSFISLAFSGFLSISFIFSYNISLSSFWFPFCMQFLNHLNKCIVQFYRNFHQPQKLLQIKQKEMELFFVSLYVLHNIVAIRFILRMIIRLRRMHR